MTNEKPSASAPAFDVREGQQFTVPKIDISSESCPVQTIEAETADGRQAHAAWRQPPGQGPFPAIVFIRGAFRSFSLGFHIVAYDLINSPTYTRFLASGYACVGATFRDYYKDVQGRGPIFDCLAIVEAVKALPSVDAESVVVFGGSGGGSIAAELAGITQLAAVVLGEPATIIYTGILDTSYHPVVSETMADPQSYYTRDLQKRTRNKVKTIACPVLVVQGDICPVNKVNEEIFIPELKAAGKAVERIVYSGNDHGFYFGHKTNAETIDKLVADVDSLLGRYLRTRPLPIEMEATGSLDI